MSDEILPTAKDVLEGIEKSEKASAASTSLTEQEYIGRIQHDAVSSQMAYAHLKGTQDHYWHKGNWSWFLMVAVGGMLFFQSVLLLLVGLGCLNFTEYEWLLPALLVQNLGQVVGLAVYAVKFLFSDISRSETD